MSDKTPNATAPTRITVTITRTYEMNSGRVLSEPGFDPPALDESESYKRRWLEESFWELCGWDRDEDHVDGSFVQLVIEEADTEFDWVTTGGIAASEKV